MTKREFVRLERGDMVLAIRHILNENGQIVVHEESEWKVSDINITHFKGQGRKPFKTAKIINVKNGQKYEIGKENSASFLLVKKQRGSSK